VRVSATQIVVVVIVVLAFAFGWAASDRRRRALPPTPASGGNGAALELDLTLARALTAYQAVLALWQADAHSSAGTPSPLALRALETFARHRVAAWGLTLQPDAPAEAQAALAGAQSAVVQLGEGLQAFARGMPLDSGRERILARAERTLAAARVTLLATSVRAG
jgi:hypothetical protein